MTIKPKPCTQAYHRAFLARPELWAANVDYVGLQMTIDGALVSGNCRHCRTTLSRELTPAELANLRKLERQKGARA